MPLLVQLKLDMIRYKGECCQKCGYDKYYGALTFHHNDPAKKKYNWNQMKILPINKIKKELDKCTLLCNNCHSEIHAKDFNS